MQTQDIVETWRQEAIQEGVKKGVQQGVQQGIQQGECAVLLRQLRQRFGDAVDAHVEQRVMTASIEQIETCGPNDPSRIAAPRVTRRRGPPGSRLAA